MSEENTNLIHKELAFEFMRERDHAIRERDELRAKLAEFEKAAQPKQQEPAKVELPKFDVYGNPAKPFSV